MDVVAATLSWQDILSEEKAKPYFQSILQQVSQARAQGQVVYPPADAVFNAFKLTPADKLKVVILGQDPYHGPNQAMGLSFSVKPGVAKPPSLVNIFKELHSDLGHTIPKSGDLTAWAKQGVLLLNATLTVLAGQPQSHAGLGWQTFTDNVIQHLNDFPHPLVYLLWGASAQKKQALINTKKHHIIKTTHPSPLSAHRGFLGSKPFSKANEWLQTQGIQPVDWSL